MRIADFSHAIRQIHNAKGRPVSNLFASPEQLLSAGSSSSISYVGDDNGILIRQQEKLFTRIYHVATDIEALSNVLERLPKTGTYVSDVVGPKESVETVAATYRKHGFESYTSLMRMTRQAEKKDANTSLDADVAFAKTKDIPEVAAFLEGLLDPYRDRTPTLKELGEAVKMQDLLIIKKDSIIAGVLVAHRKKLTAHIRYWYVSNCFHNQGIGSKLIRTFFRISSNSRRMVLWVVCDNTDAINKYHHYGFCSENLIDQIMIRRGAAYDVRD